jgi:hypothetical protein
MSPHAKSRLLTGSALAAACTIVFGGAGWGAKTALSQAAVIAVATKYVAIDTFTAFRADLGKKQQRDSMNADFKYELLIDRLSRMDSTLHDIRACQRHRRSCE